MKQSKPAAAYIQDMTVGNPLRLILAFAVPLFIGNIFQQIYNMVDTMVVGHVIGDHAISAIGASSALYILLITVVSGLNSGFAIVITQAFGAHDETRVKQCVAGTIALNLLATVVMTALSVVFLRPLMLFMNTPEEIWEDAYTYILIICAGMLATNLYNMFAGILRAFGNSRSPLYHLIISSVFNVVLDILFVAVFGMGVAGAAYATLLAQSLSALLGGITFFRKYTSYVPTKTDFKESVQVLAPLLTTGCSMTLMLGVVQVGSVIFQRANNDLGETFIAAHAASRKLIFLLNQPLGTVATAASTFVAQNWGAKKYDRIQSTLRSVLILEVLWGIFAYLFSLAFGEPLVQFTTGTQNAEIITNAAMSLRLHSLLSPTLGVLLCLRTSMQAMGKTRDPVISSCVELAMKILSAAWLIPRFGFVGTSVTEPITWALMMLYLVFAYLLQRKHLFPQQSPGES